MSLNFEDVASRLSRLEVPEIVQQRGINKVEKPQPNLFWSCVGRTGGTYTPGTDWLAQFEDPSATKWYWELSSPTGGLQLLIRENPGSTGARMARVQFNADRPFSVTADLRLTAGRVQIKVNGQIAEYTASGQVTLNLAEGLNVIEVLCNSASGDVLFLTRLYDGQTSWWTSPVLHQSRSIPLPQSLDRGIESPVIQLDTSV